jgi:calcium-dependent protein kinase
MPKLGIRKSDTSKYIEEIDILRTIDHPNVLKIYEFYEDEYYFHLVSEICHGGDLFDYIVETDFISEQMTAEIIEQVLSSVKYCHENNIVHRDLKPENLLLEKKPDEDSDELVIKVIDFGTSTLIDPN